MHVLVFDEESALYPLFPDYVSLLCKSSPSKKKDYQIGRNENSEQRLFVVVKSI